jgi:hypothetical protein
MLATVTALSAPERAQVRQPDFHLTRMDATPAVPAKPAVSFPCAPIPNVSRERNGSPASVIQQKRISVPVVQGEWGERFALVPYTSSGYGPVAPRPRLHRPIAIHPPGVVPALATLAQRLADAAPAAWRSGSPPVSSGRGPPARRRYAYRGRRRRRAPARVSHDSPQERSASLAAMKAKNPLYGKRLSTQGERACASLTVPAYPNRRKARPAPRAEGGGLPSPSRTLDGH